MVGGLEPFIDTIVVCTLTALVILSSGLWERGGEAFYDNPPAVVQVAEGVYTLETTTAPERQTGVWRDGENVFVIVAGDANEQSGNNLHRVELAADGRLANLTQNDPAGALSGNQRMPRMRAWGWGLRTVAPCSIPGSTMSAANPWL